MGRKLRSMFKPVTPRPGSGERPASPLPEAPVVGGIPAGSVVESVRPGGGPDNSPGESVNDAIARLAYERWLETGGSAVENWVWAEAELKRRGG
jgi:hypothetical protein